MVDKFEESIRVIAADATDRALMTSLLNEVGMHAEVAADGSGDAFASETPQATIVCHRVSAGEPGPPLRDADLHGRVVVFSDCVAESVVVATLEEGAHHYFDITESPLLLQARLAAALRSHSRHFQSELLVPPFRFDPAKRLVWQEERPVGLSPKEFEFAYYLFSNRGRMVGNRELMTAVWSLPRTMDSRRIDTAACRVRKKMGLEGAGRGWRLRRLRGKGYLLVEGETGSV